MTLFEETSSQPVWIALWLSPRLTIDRILASRLRRLAVPLASLGCASYLLGKDLGLGLTYQIVNWRILLIWIVVGAILGVISLYMNALFCSWIGRFLYGSASPREMRVVFAWSNVPTITGLLIVVVVLMVSRFFDQHSFFVPSSLLVFVKAVLAISNVWSLGLVAAMISQVHRIGLPSAIVTYVGGWILIVLCACVVRALLGYLFDIPPVLFNIQAYIKYLLP
jgi:signal peptidase I